MSDSREESPDWLRSFQPPTRAAIELSSGSESPLERSPLSDEEDGVNLSKLFKKEATQVSDTNDSDKEKESVVKPVKRKSPKKSDKVKRTPERKKKIAKASEKEGKKAKENEAKKRNALEKDGKSHDQLIWSLSSDSESSPDTSLTKRQKVIKKELSASKDLDQLIWSLSSDSESSPDTSLTKRQKVIKKELSASKDLVSENMDDVLLERAEESPKPQISKVKIPLEKLEKEDEKITEGSAKISFNGDINSNAVKEDISRKHAMPQLSSSKVPLLLPEKVQRSKALVECEGDSIDLSGDVGAVGRLVVSDDPSKNHEMFLDLKGTIYKTTIVPSRTFCVVSFGQSEAKIEAVMNDYIQLKPLSNVYEAETMVEGTLEGFSFDSEDEGDKAPAQADEHEVEAEQPDGKTKRKTDKKPGAARKKGKPAGGKPPKKLKKKPQAPKRGKTKK